MGNRKFLFSRRKLAQPVIAHMKEWKPDMTVSDYEPLMWQVSKALGVPHVAVNSQEFFLSSPLPKGTSLAHRIQVKGGGWIVRRFSPTADLRIVGKILVEKRPKSKATFVGAILVILHSPDDQRFSRTSDIWSGVLSPAPCTADIRLAPRFRSSS